MPFVCKLQLNNKAIKDDDIVIFDSWIDSVWEEYHYDKIEYARVKINGVSGYLSTNGSCFLSTKGTICKGEQITAETIIGYFNADGEAIPYDKPYSIIKYEE